VSALSDWNLMPAPAALRPVLDCCGSRAFSEALVRARPFADVDALLSAADSIWWSLAESDWLEAFACHPRIGESAGNSSHQFSAWSAEEQSKARSAAQPLLHSISEKNREYEARHGFIYIVCASGKSADQLLTTLDRRIGNPTGHEIKEAAEQQRQITHIRIRKWLAQ
jgi:2-oxo-4-hydroxy-4-carboxy-5-ureidoimidazoline decarboxylase